MVRMILKSLFCTAERWDVLSSDGGPNQIREDKLVYHLDYFFMIGGQSWRLVMPGLLIVINQEEEEGEEEEEAYDFEYQIYLLL